MKTFYFKIGKFNNTSSGVFAYNYNIDKCGIVVEANTFNEAKEFAIIEGEKHFGQRKNEDMWYGNICWNWDIEPMTEYFFDKEMFEDIYYV